MPRLPQPGGDAGNWGEILNDFLSESHNPDGSLKDIAQGKVTGLSAALSAKADTSAIPTTPGQVGAEPASLSSQTKADIKKTVGMQIGPAVAPTKSSKSITRIAITSTVQLVRITEPKTVVVVITNDSGGDIHVTLGSDSPVTIADGSTWTTTRPDRISLRSTAATATAIMFTEVLS